MQIDTNMRVLVVDDFSTMRAVVVKLFTELGFCHVSEAVDGLQAWKKIQAEPFDLIVCDWNMPSMTGIELLQKLKEIPEYRNIRFILITAEAKTSQIMEASRLGADGYILKPFSIETLHEKIFEVFK